LLGGAIWDVTHQALTAFAPAILGAFIMLVVGASSNGRIERWRSAARVAAFVAAKDGEIAIEGWRERAISVCIGCSMKIVEATKAALFPDGQHPGRGPAEANQSAGFAKSLHKASRDRRQAARATGGRLRFECHREELQCDGASIKDHPSIIFETDDEPQSGVECCCSVEVSTW
jgi:hypothetical protein